MTNHNKQKLQEQLLAEFDALDKLGRGIGRTVGAGAKAIGSVAGGVAGLGSAIKKGYQAGKQTVGGGGADVTQAGTKTKQTGVMGNLAKNLGNVALDTAAGSGYDYRQGVAKNPTKQVPAGTKATQAAGKQTQPQTRCIFESSIHFVAAYGRAVRNLREYQSRTNVGNWRRVCARYCAVGPCGCAPAAPDRGANLLVATGKMLEIARRRPAHASTETVKKTLYSMM